MDDDAVEVARRAGQLHITHRGGLVAEHDELRRSASSLPSARGPAALPEVETRDLAIYEALGAATGESDIAPPITIVDPEAALAVRA